MKKKNRSLVVVKFVKKLTNKICIYTFVFETFYKNYNISKVFFLFIKTGLGFVFEDLI